MTLALFVLVLGVSVAIYCYQASKEAQRIQRVIAAMGGRCWVTVTHYMSPTSLHPMVFPPPKMMEHQEDLFRWLGSHRIEAHSPNDGKPSNASHWLTVRYYYHEDTCFPCRVEVELKQFCNCTCKVLAKDKFPVSWYHQGRFSQDSMLRSILLKADSQLALASTN